MAPCRHKNCCVDEKIIEKFEKYEKYFGNTWEILF
jgi:hypothetical protein